MSGKNSDFHPSICKEYSGVTGHIQWNWVGASMAFQPKDYRPSPVSPCVRRSTSSLGGTPLFAGVVSAAAVGYGVHQATAPFVTGDWDVLPNPVPNSKFLDRNMETIENRDASNPNSWNSIATSLTKNFILLRCFGMFDDVENRVIVYGPHTFFKVNWNKK